MIGTTENLSIPLCFQNECEITIKEIIKIIDNSNQLYFHDTSIDSKVYRCSDTKLFSDFGIFFVSSNNYINSEEFKNNFK